MTLRFWLRSIVLAMICLVSVACSTDRSPRFDYGPAGEKIPFKRYENNLQLDYIHNFTKNVYEICDAIPLSPILSEQQKEVLDESGKPDYIREEFHSESDENVTEWVYVSRNRVVQFVQGERVWDGPVTDYEMTLLRKGRPEQVFTQAPSPPANVRIDTLMYNKVFTTEQDIFRFANGNLAGRMEGF